MKKKKKIEKSGTNATRHSKIQMFTRKRIESAGVLSGIFETDPKFEWL